MQVISAGAFPQGMWWILLLVSALMCCMGFKKLVWFMSVGYGLSVAGIGLTLGILAALRGCTSVPYYLWCLLLLVYGFRLGGFLFLRELKNDAYRKTLAQQTGSGKTPLPVLACMWVFCFCIYYAQTACAIYRLANTNGACDALAVAGLVLSTCGTLLEALADRQKSEQKKNNPDMCATRGLYRLCRCPNYFGEVLFWTGMFLSGVTILRGWQWLVALLGYVEIVFVMLSGVKRVEGRHIKNYGSKPEYWAYADHTPIFIPLVPLYHVTTPEKLQAEEARKQAARQKRTTK